jgi:hypothetical protein
LRGTANALAAKGPFQKPQFDAKMAEIPRTPLDRDTAANPFRTWTLVYVPYCTGDVHTGDNVVTYRGPGGIAPFDYHHVGHANVVAYLKRLAATFPDAPKLVVSGSSAGGFGSTANYDTFRQYWPDARSYLVDDSGPPLPAADVGHAQADRFDHSWKLYQLLDTFCDGCRGDFARSAAAIASKYPDDRMSFLSFVRDPTISFFFLVPEPLFTLALNDLAHGTLDAHANTKYFFAAGEGHALFRDPSRFSTGGVGLWDFLSQQTSDSPAWASHAP